MTVGAEQDALAGLGPRPRQGSRHPILPKVELLGGGIKMVKLENLLTAVITADQALASRLFHKLALYLPPTARNPLYPAALTSIVAPPLTDEAGLSVVLTARDRLSRSILRPALAARVWLQFVPLHPVTDRCQAPIQSMTNFPERQAGGKKPFHFLFRRRSLRRVLPCPYRLQPVLLQPVADGRFVLANALSDRFEGHSLCQALFQELLLHACIFAGDADIKMRSELS